MSCLLTQGRAESCRDAIGGLYRLWFANWLSLTGATINNDDQVSSLNGAPTIYEYELRGGQNTLVQNITTNRDNGTSSFSHEISITLKKMDASTNKEIKLLAYGRPQIFVQDNAGKTWLCGKDDGCDLMTGLAQSGGLKSDLYGYQLNFKAEENSFAYQVSGSTLDNPFGMLPNKPTIVKGTNS